MTGRIRLDRETLRGLPGWEGVELPPFQVDNVATLRALRDQALLFLKNVPPDAAVMLAGRRQCLVLVRKGDEEALRVVQGGHVVVGVDNPRLEFARIAALGLSSVRDDRPYRQLSNGTVVGEGAEIAEGVLIEPGVFIDHDVRIGARAVVRSGARVRRFVSIGARSMIRENSVIGGDGFGFEREEAGEPVRLPHLGGVDIGSDVEIGALNTVVAGTIEPTVIEDLVKSDDHVHIAHNCRIGHGTLLTACVELSGSVFIGKGAWLGPNSSVMQGIHIGEGATVGLGAVVTRNVAAGDTVAGNPAMPIAELKVRRRLEAEAVARIRSGGRLRDAVEGTATRGTRNPHG